MATASFRITRWRVKKPIQSLIKTVNAEGANEAVAIAKLWTLYSNDRARGKRVKFDHWRVEERTDDRQWILVQEGTLKDARMEQQTQDVPEAAQRTKPRYNVGNVEAERIFGRPNRKGGKAPTSRLGAIVLKIREQR